VRRLEVCATGETFRDKKVLVRGGDVETIREALPR